MLLSNFIRTVRGFFPLVNPLAEDLRPRKLVHLDGADTSRGVESLESNQAASGDVITLANFGISIGKINQSGLH